MLDITQEMRISYLEKLGIFADSIPGKALLRGDWDSSPLFRLHCEEAILQGYAAFRFLRKHRRGRVHVDMNNHCLSMESLP